MVADLPLLARAADQSADQISRVFVFVTVNAFACFGEVFPIGSAFWASHPGKMLGRSEIIVPTLTEVITGFLIHNTVADLANHLGHLRSPTS